MPPWRIGPCSYTESSGCSGYRRCRRPLIRRLVEPSPRPAVGPNGRWIVALLSQSVSLRTCSERVCLIVGLGDARHKHGQGNRIKTLRTEGCCNTVMTISTPSVTPWLEECTACAAQRASGDLASPVGRSWGQHNCRLPAISSRIQPHDPSPHSPHMLRPSYRSSRWAPGLPTATL